jgi:hypothetical protein
MGKHSGGDVTRLISTIDRDMAEEAIKRAYEQGREDEFESTRLLIAMLAREYKGKPEATVAEFAKHVRMSLICREHRKQRKSECLGSPRR